MNAMYCILKGFSWYNFGNKFVFIVIVIFICYGRLFCEGMAYNRTSTN